MNYRNLFLVSFFYALIMLLTFVSFNNIHIDIHTQIGAGSINIANLDSALELDLKLYKEEGIVSYSDLLYNEDSLTRKINQDIDCTYYFRINNELGSNIYFYYTDRLIDYKVYQNNSELIPEHVFQSNVNYVKLNAFNSETTLIFNVHQSANHTLNSLGGYVANTPNYIFPKIKIAKVAIATILIVVAIMLLFFYIFNTNLFFLIPNIIGITLTASLTLISYHYDLSYISTHIQTFEFYYFLIVAAILVAIYYAIKLFAKYVKIKVYDNLYFDIGISLSIFILTIVFYFFHIDFNLIIILLLFGYMYYLVVLASKQRVNYIFILFGLSFSGIVGIFIADSYLSFSISNGLFNFSISRFILGGLFYALIVLGYISVNQMIIVRKSKEIILTDRAKVQITNVQLNEQVAVLQIENESLTQEVNALKYSREQVKNLMQNISHDLKTPLAVIQGYMSMFFDDDLDKEKKDLYKLRIDDKLKYLDKLIGDIFILARIENFSFNLVKNTINIVFFTNQLISDFILASSNKNRKIITELESGSLTKDIDLKQFPRIIENVLSNAVKYTLPGGVIKISTKIIGDKFEIIVEDDGVGFDEDTLVHAFDEYYQRKKNTIRNDSTGLGLFITYQLTKMHDGDIWIESEKEKGTTIYLLF